MLQIYGSGKLICKFIFDESRKSLDFRITIKDKGGKKIFAILILPPYPIPLFPILVVVENDGGNRPVYTEERSSRDDVLRVCEHEDEARHHSQCAKR